MTTTDIVIKNASIEKALISDGYTVVPMLNQRDISELNDLYETYFPKIEIPQKWNFNSNNDISSEIRAKISEEIKKKFKPYLDRIFDNYKYVAGLIFIKKSSPEPGAKVGMHFDPTLLMNEDLNRHFNLWCPLMDVDSTNGALQVIKGSHVFFPPVHAKTIPFPFSQIDDKLYEIKECVTMKAGEAMLFDNRLLHCSMQNLSGRTRVSIILTIVAPEAQYISLYRDPKVKKNAPIEVYFQENNWHMHPLWDNSFERPKVGKKIGVLDYELIEVTAGEFLNLVKNPRPYKEYKYRIIPERETNFFLRLLRNS